MEPPLSTKPIRYVLKWQALATLAIAVVAGIWAGVHGAVSAVLGGVVNLSACVVYAFVLGLGKPASAGATVVALFRAEASKVLVIVLQLWLVLAMLAFGFLWLVTRKATTGVPSRKQAFVELAVDFVQNQVKDVYTGTSKIVAPIALTTFVLVLFMNAMDFLPVDIMAWIYEHVLRQEHWRAVPTADVNTTFALALSVFALMIFYSIKVKGLGGWVHELFCSPFGSNPLLWPFNLLFN